MLTKRYSHIDMARGVAIALVVAGHSCSSNTGDLNRMILSFHMPLFFFLSGIFAKQYAWVTILGGVKSKILKILVPQLILAITVAVKKIVPLFLKGENLADFNWLYGLGYWFLPTLFFCSLSFMLLSCCVDMRERHVQLTLPMIIVVLIFTTHYVLNIPNDTSLAKYLKLVPVAFFFYLLGNILKEWALNVEKDNCRFMDSILLIAIPLLYIVSQWNMPVKMYLSDYGSMPLFFVTSFLGCFAVVEVAKRVKTSQILVDIGQMSIAIYVWNFLVVGFVKSTLFRVLHITHLYTSGAHAALTFVISMVLLFFVSKLTLRYLPWLYGAKK